LEDIRCIKINIPDIYQSRALLRNLLKVVDGFFNFMVGILLVALTENWQRVGDLAARTIVIRVLPDERTPNEGNSEARP